MKRFHVALWEVSKACIYPIEWTQNPGFNIRRECDQILCRHAVANRMALPIRNAHSSVNSNPNCLSGRMFWNQTRLTPQRFNHVMFELHLENPGFLKTHCNIPLGLTGQNFFKTKHFSSLCMCNHQYVCMCKRRCL